GLPPGPIGLVNAAAIQAALNPKPGTSLYFVADGVGGHQFSDDFEQHKRGIEEYRQLNKH
ncbi:MAG: endolytic transglycosylase MltG, partial [Gammaproteobacteria bacterium]